MVIVPTLKHNAFKNVTVPRASELVAAYGLTKPGVKYSGDEYLKVDESKIDQVSDASKEMFEPKSE